MAKAVVMGTTFRRKTAIQRIIMGILLELKTSFEAFQAGMNKVAWNAVC